MDTPGATFTRGPIDRHVREMAITSGLSLLALFLTDILTLAYVSLLHDEVLLAIVGVGKILLFINSILVTGIVIAAGSLISRRAGCGRLASLPWLASHTLVIVVFIAGLVSVIEGYNLDHFIAWLGPTDALNISARPFLWMALLSSVLMAITQGCAQILRAVGESRKALGLVLSAAGVLAVVDPILIFGLELGLLGAGVSMVIAGGISSLFGLYWVKRHIGLSLRIRMRLLKHYGRQIGRITLPYTLGNLAMPVAITYTMGQLAVFGVSVMAGMALMDRVLQVAYCLYFALPSALVPVFAQHLGALHQRRLKAALVSAIKLVVIYGLLAWCVLLVVVPLLGNTFSLSGPGHELLDHLSRFGPGLWLLIGLDFIAVSVFITLDRAWWITFYAWLRASVGTIPFVVIGADHFGASGVMLGMWLGNALVALISIVTAVLVARRYIASIHGHDGSRAEGRARV